MRRGPVVTMRQTPNIFDYSLGGSEKEDWVITVQNIIYIINITRIPELFYHIVVASNAVLTDHFESLSNTK